MRLQPNSSRRLIGDVGARHGEPGGNVVGGQRRLAEVEQRVDLRDRAVDAPRGPHLAPVHDEALDRRWQGLCYGNFCHDRNIATDGARCQILRGRDTARPWNCRVFRQQNVLALGRCAPYRCRACDATFAPARARCLQVQPLSIPRAGTLRAEPTFIVSRQRGPNAHQLRIRDHYRRRQADAGHLPARRTPRAPQRRAGGGPVPQHAGCLHLDLHRRVRQPVPTAHGACGRNHPAS